MKLLPKSDVLAAKAAEQRLRIDEGAKLAKRVDAVRQTLLDEEKTLEAFRARKVAEIDAQIAARRAERDALKSEVAQLAKDRKELLVPLDREWDEVHRARAKADADRETARARSDEAADELRQAKAAVRQSSDALARSLQKEEAARERLEDADRAGAEAKERLRAASAIEQSARALRASVESELASRDMDVASRERGVTMRETHLESAESELAKGWALLRDREAKLARTITRQRTKR